MGHSSLLGPEPVPQEPAGRDNATLGPGDSSDSGSDRMGLPGDDDNSDAAGTGERGAVDARIGEARDIDVDRVVTPHRRRRIKSDAGERLHDDEDGDLAFIDDAAAPDPLEDEDPGGMDEDDNIPGSGSSTSGEPRPPPPERPNPEPDRSDKPDPGDEGAAPPADEKDQREKRPGRARQLLSRFGLVKAAA